MLAGGLNPGASDGRIQGVKDAHIARARAAREQQEYKPTWRQERLRMGGHRRLDRDGKMIPSHAQLMGKFGGADAGFRRLNAAGL